MRWFPWRRTRSRAGWSPDTAAYDAAVRSGDAADVTRTALLLAERHPGDHALLFDLALDAKRRRDWHLAADLNERALSALGTLEPEEPAAWNLGIAATALGDEVTARRAWQLFGLEVAAQGAAFPAGLGMLPVRLNPEGSDLGQEPLRIDGVAHPPEVVWAERLSPAHARLESVPSPGSGHRWGDVVLLDGVPRGERFDGQGWAPVLDELALLQRSEHATWVATVDAPSETDVTDLLERATSAGLGAEDWTASLRELCVACSQSRPGHDHDLPDDGWVTQRFLGLAGPTAEALRHVLDAWTSAAAGRRHSGPEPVG